MRRELILQLACIIASLILVSLFLYVLLTIPIPIERNYPKDLLEIESAEPTIRSYLWVYRAQDLVIQAFLLFAIALASLLIFKIERW